MSIQTSVNYVFQNTVHAVVHPRGVVIGELGMYRVVAAKGGGEGGHKFSGQNPLSGTKVFCRWPLRKNA